MQKPFSELTHEEKDTFFGQFSRKENRQRKSGSFQRCEQVRSKSVYSRCCLPHTHKGWHIDPQDEVWEEEFDLMHAITEYEKLRVGIRDFFSIPNGYYGSDNEVVNATEYYWYKSGHEVQYGNTIVGLITGDCWSDEGVHENRVFANGDYTAMVGSDCILIFKNDMQIKEGEPLPKPERG